MKPVHFLIAFILLALHAVAQDQPALRSTIEPQQVLVVYNNTDPKSKELANYYAKARNIPAENLLGLNCSKNETITRLDFITDIEQPIRKLFSEKNWWKLQRVKDGGIQATSSKIRVIAIMKGVPLRVSRDAAEAEGKTGQFVANEAAVDSDLALLGALEFPTTGFIPNPYYKGEAPFTSLPLYAMFLVGRIDGPSYDIARRLIDDAIAVEKTGLWGMGMIDLSGKHKMGDEWLRAIYKQLWNAGIPTQIDRHKPSLPKNYPLKDTAVYYGWYDANRSGPLLNPEWKFKRGAVAVHIHSFSAASIRATNKHWVGPILAHGAAATLGNVYEPYLQLTHQLDIFNQRLIQGHSLIEAAYMSLPILSWMNVTIGDPLYRPFARRANLSLSPSDPPKDKDYIATAIAFSTWGTQMPTLKQKLAEAGDRTRDGIFHESLGLLNYRDENYDTARSQFIHAAELYKLPTDKLRCGLLEVETFFARKQNSSAERRLEELAKFYAALPEIASVSTWLKRLNPPPPPAPKPPTPKPGETPKKPYPAGGQKE